MTASNSPEFLWGAATSSHQIEGNNSNNDWWAWEHAGRVKERSGAACDHWNRFREDFSIAETLGHTSYRFSVEWSRVEPREGCFDDAALSHYDEMISDLRTRGIEPMITLHHFTNPGWFADMGGWLSPDAVRLFSRFVQKTVSRLGENVQYWITINEPVIYLAHSYFMGVWPPGKKSFSESMRVFRNMLYGHVSAYQTIHSVYREKFGLIPKVSLAKHAFYHSPCRRSSFLDNLTVKFRNWFLNDLFLDAVWSGFLFFPGFYAEFLPARQTLDFVGINYYSQHFIRQSGFLGNICEDAHHDKETAEKNSLAWRIAPEGLYQSIRRAARFGLPVVITENGVCTDDDRQRERFIQDHLASVERARAESMPVKGYYYWSLIDNFEWDKGFNPRFGITHVDYPTFSRKIKKSAYVLSDKCRQISHGKNDANRPF